MSWGLLNFAMLAGLAGVSIPVLIHLLSRKRDPIIDWGAMQFLELGPWQRRRLNLADLLLLLCRMGLLALFALALARPFWKPTIAGTESVGSGGRRDVVLILDNSSSMARKQAEATAQGQAIAWARQFVRQLGPGDSIAVLLAKDRVRPLVDPPSFDLAKIDASLDQVPAPHGASDLASALSEAFRILESSFNTNREVIILTDNQRSAWKPGDTDRWNLIREIQKRMPTPPRVWSVSFSGPAGSTPSTANASVAPLKLPQGSIVPGRPLIITSEIENAGPGPVTRSVELLVDGKTEPGTSQVIGPIPPAGRTPLSFRYTPETPGDHLLTVRLGPGDDPIPGDDEASRAVTVAVALNVLLVDGDPSPKLLGGELAFLRAALSPSGDESRVIATRTVDPRRVDAESLKNQNVVVLANVDRMSSETTSSIEGFVAAGGGLLVVPGDRTDITWWNDRAGTWLPARIGTTKGDLAGKKPIAHPAPASFTGPSLEPLASGDNPTIGEATFFAYHSLVPNPAAAVLARLDSGDPWVVQKSFGKGKVMLFATALNAEAGTLPVNPDFVPLVHQLISELAAGAGQGQNLQPGEPISFRVPASLANEQTLPVVTPEGRRVPSSVLRGGDSPIVRFLDTTESGVYRLELPAEVGGSRYAVVGSDPRESDPAPLEAAEARQIARDWRFEFLSTPDQAAGTILSAEKSAKREVWRWLIVGALLALCGEIWLTRRTARARGL